MQGLEIAIKLLALAAQVAPVVASFFRNAIDADPLHPIAQRVASVLPAESESEAAERALKLA